MNIDATVPTVAQPDDAALPKQLPTSTLSDPRRAGAEHPPQQRSLNRHAKAGAAQNGLIPSRQTSHSTIATTQATLAAQNAQHADSSVQVM